MDRLRFLKETLKRPIQGCDAMMKNGNTSKFDEDFSPIYALVFKLKLASDPFKETNEAAKEAKVQKKMKPDDESLKHK